MSTLVALFYVKPLKEFFFHYQSLKPVVRESFVVLKPTLVCPYVVFYRGTINFSLLLQPYSACIACLS